MSYVNSTFVAPEGRSTRQDLYPSRTGGVERFISRKDPVVYKGLNVSSGPLTLSQMQSFENNGFLIIDDFLSDHEVNSYRSELQELLKRDDLKGEPHVITEPSSDEIRSVFDIHHGSGLFARLGRSDRLRGIARQILAGDVYVHQSRVNAKPGFKGSGFYWHSDFETWHTEDGMPRMRALSCSILLTDNHPYNGPLMFIPGSHLTYVSCSQKTPEKNFKSSLKDQTVGTPSAAAIHMMAEKNGIDLALGRAGALVVFDCNTLHASGGNISPFPRSNLFYVFNSVENKLQKPYCGQNPRPEFLGNRSRLV